jgi:hypothetical protein
MLGDITAKSTPGKDAVFIVTPAWPHLIVAPKANLDFTLEMC